MTNLARAWQALPRPVNSGWSRDHPRLGIAIMCSDSTASPENLDEIVDIYHVLGSGDDTTMSSDSMAHDARAYGRSTIDLRMADLSGCNRWLWIQAPFQEAEQALR